MLFFSKTFHFQAKRKSKDLILDQPVSALNICALVISLALMLPHTSDTDTFVVHTVHVIHTSSRLPVPRAVARISCSKAGVSWLPTTPCCWIQKLCCLQFGSSQYCNKLQRKEMAETERRKKKDTMCINWRKEKKIIDRKPRRLKMAGCRKSGGGLQQVIHYRKSRRSKMAGCRRSEIQMEAYDGLPIIRSPEG